MLENLKNIIAHLTSAKEQLEKLDPTNSDIQNVMRENKWHIEQFEAFSKRLADNIELTSKVIKG